MPKLSSLVRRDRNFSKYRSYRMKNVGAWSSRRTANYAWKKKGRFNRNVRAANLKGQPMQYRLYGVDREPSSQQPSILMNISNIKALQENTNPMYYRTSMRVKPISLTLSFRVDNQDQPFNQVCVALVRHRRSEEIVAADIQDGNGPLLDNNNKPFLPIAAAPNTDVTNMTGVSNFAHPRMLLKYFNPKVVDVIKTWTVNVQPETQTPNQNFTPFREFTYVHKFKQGEVWKYQNMRNPEIQETTFPYNNKCYQLITFSDSGTLTAAPAVSCAARFAFKDID